MPSPAKTSVISTTIAATAIISACLGAHAARDSTQGQQCERKNGMLYCHQIAAQSAGDGASAQDPLARPATQSQPKFNESARPTHGILFDSEVAGIAKDLTAKSTVCAGTTLMNKFGDGTTTVAERNSPKCPAQCKPPLIFNYPLPPGANPPADSSRSGLIGVSTHMPLVWNGLLLVQANNCADMCNGDYSGRQSSPNANDPGTITVCVKRPGFCLGTHRTTAWIDNALANGSGYGGMYEEDAGYDPTCNPNTVAWSLDGNVISSAYFPDNYGGWLFMGPADAMGYPIDSHSQRYLDLAKANSPEIWTYHRLSPSIRLNPQNPPSFSDGKSLAP